MTKGARTRASACTASNRETSWGKGPGGRLWLLAPLLLRLRCRRPKLDRLRRQRNHRTGGITSRRCLLFTKSGFRPPFGKPLRRGSLATAQRIRTYSSRRCFIPSGFHFISSMIGGPATLCMTAVCRVSRRAGSRGWRAIRSRPIPPGRRNSRRRPYSRFPCKPPLADTDTADACVPPCRPHSAPP